MQCLFCRKYLSSWGGDCELLDLAQVFVAKVPKLEFSPAEVLSFLLANKHPPHHAIANVAA
jgi:chaperone BCS1